MKFPCKDNFGVILSDPVQLGEFLQDAAEISALEKAARHHAIGVLLRGEKIPGWLLRRRQNLFVRPCSLTLSQRIAAGTLEFLRQHLRAPLPVALRPVRCNA
jgi:hypothetical protein